MTVINGKVYPMWNQFVEKKETFIGEEMFSNEEGGGQSESTIITDVTLEPNGDDSAMISFIGKDYTCACDVRFCGISPTPIPGFIVIATSFGDTFYIKSSVNK